MSLIYIFMEAYGKHPEEYDWLNSDQIAKIAACLIAKNEKDSKSF